MESSVMAWKAARRAGDVRKMVVDKALANAPIPSGLLKELAELADDATAKLHAIPKESWPARRAG